MSNLNVVELIGYFGSALVVVSMLMTSVVRLRVINLIGSAIFAGYALIIRSYPTALMNVALMAINIYHLVRLLKEQKQYRRINTDLRDGYISFLLDEYGDDIRAWFPEFDREALPADVVCLMCCDRNPAGLFLGRRTVPGDVEVLLDYSTPVYRDTSVGTFLHKQMAEQGFSKLIFRSNAPRHTEYMEKVGYKKEADGSYVLELSR